LLQDPDGAALLKALQAQIAAELGIAASLVNVHGLETGRRLQSTTVGGIVSTTLQKVALDSFLCVCQSGYAGYNCEANIDECASSPCLHGGTCQQGLDSYTCTCSAGYVDTPVGTCYAEMDECASDPCQKSGTCFDHVDRYTCVCARGYSGYNCEINNNECASSPCMNGGVCTDGVNKYGCTCK